MFTLNSQMFTARKICQIRNHFDFEYGLHFLSFPFSINTDDSDDRCTNTICWSRQVFSPKQHWRKVDDKRAPDLGWFIRYSLFGPLCCVSFIKFCLHPGALKCRVHSTARSKKSMITEQQGLSNIDFTKSLQSLLGNKAKTKMTL